MTTSSFFGRLFDDNFVFVIFLILILLLLSDAWIFPSLRWAKEGGLQGPLLLSYSSPVKKPI